MVKVAAFLGTIVDYCAERLIGTDRRPPWPMQAKGVTGDTMITPPATALQSPAPVPSQVLGITGNGQIVGWFQRSGSCVVCVAPTTACEWSVQTLAGFREAVAVLGNAGAVSLEYVPAGLTTAGTSSVQDQPCIGGG